MNPIKFNELIDADNKAIIKSFDEIIAAYMAMADEIKRATKEIVSSIDKVNITQKNGQDTVADMSDQIKELQEQYKLYLSESS